MSAWFMFLAAMDHFICWAATDTYTRMILNGSAIWMRWVEYSISASVMNLQIALLSGCDSLSWCILVVMTTAGTMLTGGFAENASTSPFSTRARNMITVFSWLLYLSAWNIIAVYFFQNAQHAPDFVWSIFFCLLALESCFGVVFLIWYNATTTNSLFRRELAYAALSLTAKQLLAWLTYSGSKFRHCEA
jgi:hypothetical protein